MRILDPLLLPAAILVGLSNAMAAPQVCGTWETVPSPNPPPGTYNALTAVSSASPSEAWATGNLLVFRWDGAAWTDVALPSFPVGTFGVLISLADVAAFPGGTMFSAGVASGRILGLQWENEAWSLVESFELRPQTVYPFGLRTATTKGVAGATPDDIWIVGSASGFGDGRMSIVPMTVHWDGDSWTEMDPPWPVDDVIVLEDVVALASDDVWAVGWGRGSSVPNRAIVYHWNGTRWRHVRTPAFTIYQSKLEAVAAIAPDDVWAVGNRPGGALLMHWDGVEWSISPSPIGQTTSVGAVAALASDDVWAIATQRDTFLHWDGTSWNEVAPPAVPGATSLLRADLAAVGPCDLWSVGYQSDGSTFGAGWLTRTPLIERLLNRTVASCRFRNGSGINPVGFDCVSMPVLGSIWDSTIATSAQTVSTSLGLAANAARIPFLGGEVLLGPSPAPIFLSGLGTYSVPIPGTAALLGGAISAQGFRIDLISGDPTLVLLNAQDLTLGLAGR